MIPKKSIRLVTCTLFIRLFAMGLLFLCVMSLWAQQSADQIHYRLAVKYKNEHKFDQAIEEYKKVLIAFPDHYNTYLDLAEIRQEQKQYRLAIFNLKKALTYNPGWSVAQKRLATAYELDNQHANAIREWQDYYQVSDPAERDSIQHRIDRIIAAMKGGGKTSDVDEARPETAAATGAGAGGTSKIVADSGSVVPVVAESTAARKDTSVALKKKSPVKGDSKAIADRGLEQAIALYGEAVASQDSALFEKSLGALKKILQGQPRNSGAHFYAGLIYRKQNKPAEAKIHFLKSVDYPSLGIDAYFYLGKIAGESKRYTEAIKYLTTYRQKSEYAPGIKEAGKLIDEYTQNLKALRGDTLKIDIKELASQQLQGEISKIGEPARYSAAEVTIDSLLSLAIVDTFTDAGQMMLSAVQEFKSAAYDKAIELFRKTMVKFPKNEVSVRSIYNIGICYLYLNNYTDAQKMFGQITENHPNHPLASKSLFLTGHSLLERHELSQAERVLRTFIQKNRTHQWYGIAYEKLGDCYGQMADSKRAIDAYNLALRTKLSVASNVGILVKCADMYLKVNNIQRALDNYKKAAALCEKQQLTTLLPEIVYKMGDLGFKQKQYQEALRNYRDAVTRFPEYHDTPWGLFQIASIHKIMGSFDKAVELFNLLIKKYPDDYWAQQARWKLEDTVWENEYKGVLKK